MLARLVVAAAALAAAVSAQLTITSPSSSIWWIANSQNNLAWTCDTSPYQTFTVFVNNNDTNLLSGMLAIYSEEPNYDCSQEVIPSLASELQPGDGYWLTFANPLNASDVYAVSQNFQVKPQGSAYASTSSASGSSTATGSAPGSSVTSTSSSGSAASFSVHEGLVGAIAVAAGVFGLGML